MKGGVGGGVVFIDGGGKGGKGWGDGESGDYFWLKDNKSIINRMDSFVYWYTYFDSIFLKTPPSLPPSFF